MPNKFKDRRDLSLIVNTCGNGGDKMCIGRIIEMINDLIFTCVIRCNKRIHIEK